MKARWIITAASAALFFGGSLFTSLRDPWFQNLQRPSWLTFEFLIPLIWTFIWVCLTISAIIVWEKSNKKGSRPWNLLLVYAAIALLTSLYSPVVVELRSLTGGMIVGGLATVLVYILAFVVKPISQTASWLFLPYALWGPFGTYLTWLLLQLNSPVKP
ncbi:TspO/MBR family protein [Nostoc sp. FACHB-87]|uniref:TspO/MBR family protein n=1 Tax=Nostocales TaxID=1161 RepID=UPI0016840E7F|nr:MULTISPECIES: tryptophan-rich sensory protein [Nostocales]MBD2455910.1 TspO/MBR family protein [Nostoc sp. FACHB-87]MBD2474496.1 TspO/MBR family protein [Anabaena sp. FACHB-83]MBD2486963.1 TspO/MBR family protein [Aulosira sp. FACHB-615]